MNNRIVLLSALALGLLTGGCRKEPIYELTDVSVLPPSPNKDQPKTNEQYVSVLHANLFQSGMDANDLYRMGQCIESIGDKELAREVIISNFMNRPGVIMPTDAEMRSDIDAFVVDTYRRFLVREHDEGRTVGDSRQPGLLQLGRSGREQCRRDQRRVRVGRVDEAAAELLHHHHRLDGAKAHAALRFGNREAGQPEAGQFGVDSAGGAARARDRVAAVEGEALLNPARDGFAQRELFRREIEVHRVQLPSTVCATMLRCTSLEPP